MIVNDDQKPLTDEEIKIIENDADYIALNTVISITRTDRNRTLRFSVAYVVLALGFAWFGFMLVGLACMVLFALTGLSCLDDWKKLDDYIERRKVKYGK